MWRRAYLLLLAVRLYFALSPSYIHPDEHFQGPEVIAGHVFNWPTHSTWEFTSTAPIRSYFPLWMVYGLPLKFLAQITPGETPAPLFTFYFLRILFFLLSFVLEDWALQELTSPRQRFLGLTLLASSYVTWTYQTHTFSNSIETICVLWALVFLERIRRSSFVPWGTSLLLGFTCIFGLFNRITFPVFLLIPGLRLLQSIVQRPLLIVPLGISAAATAAIAVYIDTSHYNGLTVTPINNLLYNTDTANLATHGLHPRWTHMLVNLPTLLGPIFLLRPALTPALMSAVGGILALSALPHQEARFLLPCVPLLLASVSFRRSALVKQIFVVTWVLFNTVAGVFFGIYHQAGVVPAQDFIASTNATKVVFWKTYNPPTWILGEKAGRIETINAMGAPMEKIKTLLRCERLNDEVYLAAPLMTKNLSEIGGKKVWETKSHIGLDDLDWEGDGIRGTIERVVFERGLGVWEVKCDTL
ncbi:Similar to GPI mannosyltransferase 4; acc. no. Q5BAX7 [Pyronema omphalodes CBS 100304]|uniref:Mannosyltransferase n=1 Tax=Pyronema omphalodes (strain CBS 100304) TaxID=1076935 RepID=U4KYR8_PYROM|nr:Similar to GPI mannosyltransferase 4; acc. no. Q5BAX7 [Pyronema omphalodes CBS 100304]